MIKVIDYKAGNARSVMHALERLGYEAGFARSPGGLSGASRIILPGVGSARATMDSLAELELLDALGDMVLGKKVLFLGICVGMQILFEHSEEGDTDCLGWLGGRVERFDAKKVRVPQMGWNKVNYIPRGHCNPPDDFFYFVNSYYACPSDQADIWGITDYNGPFTSAVRRGNIYGTQFHLEKSGEAGLGLLKGFIENGYREGV